MDITQILRGESSKDCECCAWAQFECACGAQWPESVAREAADELDRLRAELAELRARAGELERQVRDKHEAATVDEICNAYESGVGHRGRPTANVNPYRQGTAGHVAYRLGATGTKHNAPQDDARDAERLQFLIDESVSVCAGAASESQSNRNRPPRYWLEWSADGAQQVDTYETPREAIDAAILATKVKP